MTSVDGRWLMPRCARNSCRRWFPKFVHTGIVVDDKWFCSSECVEGLARRRLLDVRPSAAGLPSAVQIRLGVWLQHMGVISDGQLSEALRLQKQTGKRLGQQLQAMGCATAEAVVRALAQQAGIGYLTSLALANVTQAPGGLSAHAARALGIVPFCEADNGRIKVACIAPVPRMGLSAFRRLTGLTPTPYLVSDEQFTELQNAYGSAVADASVAHFVETRSFSDAVATITAAVANGRNTRVTDARLEPYTWVRVQAADATHDVVLSDGGGPLCPTAPSTSL
jgi:hypothetical protein